MKYSLLLIFLLSLPLFASEARLTKLNGNVLRDGLKAKLGDELALGQEIKVSGSSSFAEITFKDKSRMLLRNGSLKIQRSEKKNETLVELIHGLLFSAKAKSSTNLNVRTQNAVMGVRGTKFFVEVSNQETYLCVCEGSVEIKNQKSREMVKKDEDVHVLNNVTSFTKNPANQSMQEMAWSGFEQMGFKK